MAEVSNHGSVHAGSVMHRNASDRLRSSGAAIYPRTRCRRDAPGSSPRTFKITHADIHSRPAKPPHGIMELSGFRVSIHSDGEELKGYSVEVSPDGKKTTCWVPSQSGKVRHSNAGQWSMKLKKCEGVRGEV